MAGLRRGAVRALQLMLIAAALGCIALGVARGEVAAVLRKAAFVCLECIGVMG